MMLLAALVPLLGFLLLLGALWGHFLLLWVALGVLLGSLGALSGALGRLLGHSWGAPGALLGPLGAKVDFLIDFEATWELPRAPLGHPFWIKHRSTFCLVF